MFRRAFALTGVGILAGALVMGTTVYGAQNSEEKTTIRMLHYWGDTDADVSSRYLKEILEKEFPKAFPDVELVQDTCDNETYKSKIKILMASDEQPDIMFSYGGGFMKSFVDAGKVLALDDYMDDFYKEHMKTDVQENFIFDGQQYGTCCTYWTGVLYCNQELFDQAGAEIPETYEELLDSVEKFRNAGIEPIALGMVNKWPGQQWINNFTIQLGGAEHYKEMAKGEVSLDDSILTKAAELTQNLIDADAFCDDMYTLTSGEAEKLFLNGGTAMIYIGSWFTTFAEESLGDNLTVTKMPTVPDAKYPDDYHGGGVNGWIASADTEYPELAANIVAWLSYELSCYEPESGGFNVEAEDQKREIGSISQQILDMYADKKEGGIAWDTLMTPKNAGIWLDSCADLFEGKLTAKSLVESLAEQIDQKE